EPCRGISTPFAAKKHFFAEFKAPTIIENENFKGTVNTIFVVTTEGDFKLIYINTPYQELKQEIERAFKVFPKITPGWYNNHPVEMRFVLPITFPLNKNSTNSTISEKNEVKEDLLEVVEKNRIADSTFLEHSSQLNIPFTHQKYVDYEFAMHKASGTHTASKPYLFNQVNKHFNLTEAKKKFLKPNKRTWAGNKVWNEHLLQVKRKDFWFTLDFLLDVQVGKDNSSQNNTYNNSRIFTANGALGDKLSFSATFYESQGRFADYINSYVSNLDRERFKPISSRGLIPGRGKAKGFGRGYDYPVAEGYVSYTPNKFFNFQFGHGKNFIGDGYRSFLLSDVSSPSTYLKMDVNFWKFKYTNIWMWGLDVRENIANTNNREHLRKYIALHYLSINVSEKLNLGLFEAAVSAGQNGIDISFLNPLMFYRSVEFNRGEDVGNAVIGLTSKYKLNDNISLYSQLMIDEFSIGNLSNLGDWRNKFAYQLGAKYFNAFDVDNLFLQLEYNYARPYTFAHQKPILNYAHYSQPLGHLWGANFWEIVAIARYKKDRWSGSAKINIGKKGFDFPGQAISYGGDVYQSYEDRFGDTGNELAQGNTANIFIAELQANYLINPSNNLNLFGGLSYRKFSPKVDITGFPKGNNVWLSVGIRADLFNWYFDF
ncbi:MAG: gliding motility protein RemB, partial [Flavobacteriaceae bacterium]